MNHSFMLCVINLPSNLRCHALVGLKAYMSFHFGLIPSNVDIELLRLSGLPSIQAATYQQMWAYGNHYRVENEEDGHGFVAQDYGIANIFGAEEGRGVGVSIVGILKEIIVVRYSYQRRIVFRGIMDPQ